MSGPFPSLSCVLLTMGDRPAELARAVASVQAQDGDPIEVVVVGNGAADIQAPDGVTVVQLPQNVGIPAGRNAGVLASSGDVVLFVDDDGWLPDAGTAERLRAAFADDPRLGIVSFRIVDPVSGRTERRHVPRLRAGDPERSSDVTTFLGGACGVRREVFDRCGLLPGDFFYAHEETDLAWRALDAGYRIHYAAREVLHHPAGAASARHASFYFHNARNRVWLARRRLPWPLAVVYVLAWAIVTALRERRRVTLAAWGRGMRAGLQEPAGTRAPMSCATALHMAVLGRPPVI